MNSIIDQHSLSKLRFDNSFTQHLPADPVTDNYPRQVPNSCYSRVTPTSVSNPTLVAFSKEMATTLNLSMRECESSLFTETFAGNKLLQGMDPFAMCYGGHQFGSWAGQLGDGRAINLGEVINEDRERWMLQLKGAGLTPYSRTADGLAVLRSSVREFLCSEAMHHLGIPTTRALSLVTSGEHVMRDMFYDGHPKHEPGAVVCRVSPSFTRFGNFEILAARNEIDLLQKLVDYTILTNFPHLGQPSLSTYISWFREICNTTAELIVHWMRVGFVHGVMNTDNMSICGLTIDYGPYGWLESYDAKWTPNTTDSQGKRYCYGNQPHIAQWNLIQLANALYPVIQQKESLQQELSYYNKLFTDGWNTMMAGKLGFKVFSPTPDNQLIGDLTEILQLVETDMTIFFRNLSSISTETNVTNWEDLPPFFTEAYYSPQDITDSYKTSMLDWLARYIQRIREDGQDPKIRKEKMDTTNPKYVFRNYMAQLAIDKAEKNDFSLVNELLELLKNPYSEQPKFVKYFAKRPEWARNRPGCSMLSCSS